ncbi:hypothetical protein F511_04273 [Dorcoceras hygrometricum]|uniref:Uncharacterized protein n=1 Tax=Dorcoceras hygrometricum TaxID=472368 RepID=A0A2Z7BY64_9LAMI|nr:hypothetical protein F511_04273 [Dorcoceras hygrometricum]
MASSLISNSHHIDFDVVFGMEDTDLVQTFESLIATGLKNFLGCPAMFNEAALTEFFANSSVREDGLVVSTVNGVTVEISEEVFAATFELPVEGLTDLSEVPKNLVFDERSLLSISKEQVKRTPVKKKCVTKKRLAAGDAEVAPIVKKKRTTKGKPIAAKRLPVEEPVGVSTTSEQPAAEVATDVAIEQVLAQLDLVIKDSDVERGDRIETWFDRAFDEEFETVDQENQDSEDEIDFDVDNQELPVFDETRTIPEAGGSKSFGDDKAGEKAIGSTHSTEEHILPRISIHDKGKEIMEEDEPVRENPTSLKILKEKEKLMLEWAETDSLEMAVRRSVYILAKYRELLLRKFLESHRKYHVPGQPWTATASQIIDILSAAHSKSLEVLLTQQKEHGLLLEQSCSSTFFDDSVGSGAVLTQLFSLAKSTCWVRPMVQIDGVWTPIQGPDFWRSSCKLSLFVNKRQVPERVVDTDFVPHGFFIEPVQYWGAAPSLIKTWAWRNVCTEIIRYSMFGCLRPVCREIVVYNLGVERIPNYLLSDFQKGVCTDTFVGFFSGSSVQTDSEIELSSSDGDTVYHSPSPILQEIDSFEENLQFDLGPVVSTNALEEQFDSQMNFDTTDIPLDDTAEAQTSLLAATVDLSPLLDDLKTSLSQCVDTDHSDILSRLRTIEQGLHNTLGFQNDYFRNLIQGARQEGKNNDDLPILRLNELKKTVLTQGVTADTASLEIRKAINAVDAKIILWTGSGDAKKGEGSSSRRPLPTPVHHSEGTGDAVRLTEPTQEDIDNANRAILERMRNEDSLRAEIERNRARRERRLSRSGAYKSRRGF